MTISSQSTSLRRTPCTRRVSDRTSKRRWRAFHADFRAAIVLSDLEGLSLPETAEALGIPVGTVKSRVFRARRLLAEQLGNQNTP